MEKKELQISPILVFFLVHSVQVGVGVLGFQKTISDTIGNDSWMAVIASGIVIHIIIWLMYTVLNRHQKDLIQIHKELFGKWFGGVMSFIWIAYWLMVGIVVFRSYIEIIQVWMFPLINVVMISIIFIIIIYYCVAGGFRVVAGICFLGVVIPFYIFLTFFFPLEYAQYRNLLPIWNHSIKDMTIATKDMMLGYLGFSTLFMYYPFIKHPKKSQKWAHFGNLLTVGIYLFILLVTICYFSEKQLSLHNWATLSLWKIIEMPFVERFEYIGITSWVLIILPNICLGVWAAVKGIQELFSVKKPKKVMIFMLIILFITNILITGRDEIAKLNEYMSLLGLSLLLIYLPMLTLLSFIITKLRKRKAGSNA